MNKKIFIFCLIIFILIIAAANYYYFIYQKPIENQSSEEQTGQEEVLGDQESNEESGELTNVVIDGIFQKTEDNFIYIIPKDEDVVEQIKLTEETIFSEMVFSSQIEFIEERDISLSDLEEESSISIVVVYDEGNPEEKTALAVRVIIISD